MDHKTQRLLNGVNKAIIKFRGAYSAWSKKRNISYNEMLVLYTIRDDGYCTQKQICDNYLLPRQTINHVFLTMRKNGILEIHPKYRTGKEKVFVLSAKGKAYAQPFLDSLNQVEERAIQLMGEDKIREMTALVCQYDEVLNSSLEESLE